MTKLIPMPGYALVCPVTEEQTGGFIIQEVAIEKQQKGVVVDVGKAVKNEWGTLIETDVVPGDVIYHRAWGHETIQVDGKEYRVVKFLDICLKVQGDKSEYFTGLKTINTEHGSVIIDSIKKQI